MMTGVGPVAEPFPFQQHASKLALSFDAASRAPVNAPRHPSAYKYTSKTNGHRTALSDLSHPNNMEQEHQIQNKIEQILDKVHSLSDLSADKVDELRRVSENSIVINKFKVSPTEYHDWLNKIGNDNRGIEFDAQNACLILKGRSGWMHEAATGIIYIFFDKIRERLSAAGSRCFLTGSTDCSLEINFVGSIKQPDASLMEFRAEWPVIVLEVEISETTRKLFKDAQRWLEGSDGNTKLVILVDIQEKERRNTSNDKWDLSENDFREIHHRTLSRRILQWYRLKGIRVVGDFHLSVHLCYNDGDNHCILDKAAFSPGRLIDLTTIEDIPLRLGHLMPDGGHLDEDRRLLFPLKNLVDTLQHGFENTEIDRVNDLATDIKKKYF
ncbi:hypothetical protein BGW36DRAFT_363365 [Talaromyces proteolyticus]|uniref:Uncharacterized protein n=1 Tax=Talaromyces proteolyticus TaxID=1131652 RepID=A0AAD4KHD7_9EURO|nr:uncharacterized protein BGW36DRAFT_363365 [Talaromyces proteolyticus]KAH8692373.1 hypothetical protein BGW36DRAFT_363365 [Talaromyces proteolyticus]